MSQIPPLASPPCSDNVINDSLSQPNGETSFAPKLPPPLLPSFLGPNPHHRRVKERGLGLQTGTKGKVEKGSFPLFFMKVLSRLASPLHSSPRPGAGYHLRVTPEGRPGGGGALWGKGEAGSRGKGSRAGSLWSGFPFDHQPPTSVSLGTQCLFGERECVAPPSPPNVGGIGGVNCV